MKAIFMCRLVLFIAAVPSADGPRPRLNARVSLAGPGRAYTICMEVRMNYRLALHKSDEGYSVSLPGLPGCWSPGCDGRRSCREFP